MPSDLSPFIKTIFLVYTFVCLVIVCREIYRKLAGKDLEQSFRSLWGATQANLASSKNIPNNWGALAGAVLFISGTSRFLLTGIPILYVIFACFGIFGYLVGSFMKVPRMKSSGLFLMVGIPAGCALPFFVRAEEVYYVLMGAGLLVAFASIIIQEVMKPARPAEHPDDQSRP